MADSPASAFRHWPTALALAVPALAVLALGNDASWDLRNYHLYGPHAWLHDRHAIDIGAAQMQGHHSPLLDLPMYLLAMAGAPAKLIGLWLALPAMAALWCLLRLQERLSPQPPDAGARLLLALLAASGAAFWSALGMAMNDAFVGAGMLGALVLLLDAPAGQPGARACLAAGLLAGATAGLKLSGAFYCPALALALLALPGDWRTRGARLALLAAGGAAGFALSYGWWGWSLWQAHGNPFFPYFNQWFQSPDIAAQSWVDLRFRPRGIDDLLLAPVQLLWRSQRFSEAGMKDPRLLLALLGFAWLAWSMRGAAAPLRARSRLLLVFVLASFIGWALQSGIYRYAIAIEALGALAAVLVLARIPRGRGVAMLLALVVLSVATRRPDWGRVHDARGPLPRLAAALPADALVVTASGEPLGYLALALPDDVPMLGLDNNLIQPVACTGLPRRARARLAAHTGPVYLATGGDPREQASLRARHGLDARGDCIAVRAGIGDATLCPQQRVAAPTPTCPPTH